MREVFMSDKQAGNTVNNSSAVINEENNVHMEKNCSAGLIKRHSFYEKYVKRALDIFLSLLVLVLFCWLYGIVALLVRIRLGKPVIFHQQRPGRINPETGREELFGLCKFRTMTDARDGSGNLLPDDVRLTKFGRVLRSTSLDELPEVWNILKGDMSLVGPRPLLTEYLPYYTKQEHMRHSVRPGLTGLAQVNGRTAISWQQKFAYDLEYANGCSFCMDVKILFMTVFKIIKKSDIYVGSEVPAGRFDDMRKRELSEAGALKAE